MEPISYQDFVKLELKVGEIKAIHEIPGADKLFRLEVDTGEPRELVAGIKGHYRAEDLVGRQIVVLTNLEPRKIRGVSSSGMLLAAHNGETGDVVLLGLEKPVPNGSMVS